MDQEERTLLFKIGLDLVCLILVGFPILLFYAAGKPYERGFFCDDESVRYPYKDSTVPSWCLYIFGLGLPIATIIITEFFLSKKSKQSLTLKIFKFEIPSWYQEVYKHVGVFGFGAAVSQLTTDIAKYSIGRLRPHFISVCNPNVDCLNPQYKGQYIINFACMNYDLKKIKDMRLSFPSGHSSFSMYCMLFLAIYIQARFKWNYSKLLKHVLQFLALILAIATALSRVSDYKHHWSDVLSGVILGIVVAVLNVVFVSDLFPKVRETYLESSVSVDGQHEESTHEPSEPPETSKNSVI